jgi:hypothetical protein
MRNAVVELRNRWSDSKRNVHRTISGRGSEERLPSFPFISGDTFRSFADYILESDADLESLKFKLSEDRNLNPSFFCSVTQLENLSKLSYALDLKRFTIYVHNGDVIPIKCIMDIQSRVRRIFCVNWLGDRQIAEPIPIGIENANWNMNGKLQDWIDCYPANLGRLLTVERPVTCFQSFNVQTNPEMRKEVMPIFAGIEDAVTCEKRISRARFRSYLRHSKFVISPPGNGPDCHRTWEAMYAGAVPVVLKKAWPFGHLNLPVLIVNEWCEAAELIRSNSKNLYDEIWESSNQHEMYFLPLLSRLVDQAGD